MARERAEAARREREARERAERAHLKETICQEILNSVILDVTDDMVQETAIEQNRYDDFSFIFAKINVHPKSD